MREPLLTQVWGIWARPEGRPARVGRRALLRLYLGARHGNYHSEAIKRLLIAGLCPCSPSTNEGTRGYKVALKRMLQVISFPFWWNNLINCQVWPDEEKKLSKRHLIRIIKFVYTLQFAFLNCSVFIFLIFCNLSDVGPKRHRVSSVPPQRGW